MNCPICKNDAARHADATVRNEIPTTLFRCNRCGFMFMSPVTWLAEAYQRPIDPTDVGYVARNIDSANFLSEFLRPLHREDSLYCDYGAGCGMLVRLMRDRGFRFHWHDRYAANLFASYCEAIPESFAPYRLITAIEVFEHLPDPLEGLREILQLGSTILFTTELQPEPAPMPDDWWYYGLGHGQHISFYTEKALEILASTFGLRYLRIRPSWHLFATEEEIETIKGWGATQQQRRRSYKPAQPAALSSLTSSDHQAAVRLVSEAARSLIPANIDLLEGFGRRGNQTPTTLDS